MHLSERAQEILGIADAQGYVFVPLKHILYLKADNSYTKIHTIDGKNYVASRLLKYFEKELINAQFIRVHQSYVVNKSHLQRYSCREKHSIVLSSGDRIPVSRSRRKRFMQSFIRA